jgi:hypothetical protein
MVWFVSLVSAAVVACLAAPSWAGCLATTQVTDALSLQQAISLANSGTCVDATVANNVTLTGSSSTLLTGTLTLTATSNSVQIDGNGGSGFTIGSGGNLAANNLTFTDFVTPGAGGAFNVQPGGTLSLNNDILTSNTAIGNSSGLSAATSGSGGAIFIATGSSATVNGTTLSGNRAIGGTGNSGNPNGGSASGGGIYNQGTLTLTNSTVTNNQATGFNSGNPNGGSADGGGIDNTGTLTLTNSTVTHNQAIGFNGGSPNSANGGGIDNTGTLTLTNSTVTNNQATGGNGGTGDGGGIFQSGTLTLLGTTTLTSNQAGTVGAPGSGLGGGIDLSNGTFQLVLGVTNPELVVPGNDAIVGGALDLTLNSALILQNLIDQPIKFLAVGGNLTGNFNALELDGMSCEWTPSSVDGGVADCADPFASNDALVYQVAVDKLPGVPPDPYYQFEITSLAAVPEPGTLSLLGSSICVLAWLRRGGRRRGRVHISGSRP